MTHARAFRAALAVALLLSCLPAAPSAQMDTSLFASLRWRSIGPNRGGRSQTGAGSASRPLEYYFGATGGGVWKTTDGGLTWRSVSDKSMKTSSVGAIAIAASNPDIVYAGMGETELRGNVIQGDGVYKTTDAGKTWTSMGLEKTQTISRIRVHPTNPDIVYVAALGNPYSPNPERGVFRSKDGGKAWERVLFRDDKTGAVDLAMDPKNPDVLYAGMWEVFRTPHSLSSGGPGSGLFKSTDGGQHWSVMPALTPAASLPPARIPDKSRIPIFSGAAQLRAPLCAEARASAATLLRRTPEVAAESVGKARAVVPVRLRGTRPGRD